MLKELMIALFAVLHCSNCFAANTDGISAAYGIGVQSIGGVDNNLSGVALGYHWSIASDSISKQHYYGVNIKLMQSDYSSNKLYLIPIVLEASNKSNNVTRVLSDMLYAYTGIGIGEVTSIQTGLNGDKLTTVRLLCSLQFGFDVEVSTHAYLFVHDEIGGMVEHFNIFRTGGLGGVNVLQGGIAYNF